MRSLVFTFIILGMMAVYETNSIIPKYFVDRTTKGDYRVYDSKQLVVPKYIVKQDRWGNGYRVYEAGKPVLPLYRIKKRGTEY